MGPQIKVVVFMFLVIPAVDLKDGKCVQLRQGREEDVLLELEDPAAVAEKWGRLGAPRLHVVDLDGALRDRRANEGILREIVRRVHVPVQFGGGIRTPEDVGRLLEMGVTRVILGTIALERPEVLEEISERYGRDRITVALDSRGGRVVVRGWRKTTGLKPSEAVKKFEVHASEVLYTNVDREGLMRGVAEEAIREMVDATSMGVIVSGGVSTVEDVKRIKRLGARGVVIGSAIYTGKLDYREALRAGRD
jgi:phosphoribosylformimino-5-aminoimidazole carboxamide ribotide isomerase